VAKYEYKPYRVGKRKNPNTRYFILALVVVENVLASGGGDNETGVSGSVGTPPEPGAGAEAPGAAEGPAARTPGDTPPLAFNPIPHSTADMTEATLEVIDKALKDLKAGRIIEARDSLNSVLLADLTPEYRKSIKKRLSELTAQWLFNKEVLPGDTYCQLYRVKPGEVLEKIGKKYKVPFELLMRINGIKRPELLQAGQVIKVVKGPFHIKVYRSTFTMDVYLGNHMFIKSYRIGLGTKDRETPTGRWRVKPGGKLIEPPWYDEETGKTHVAGDR